MKNEYKNIVIATDGSFFVQKAIDIGLDLAEVTGACAHAIFVTDVSAVATTTSDLEILEKNLRLEAYNAMEYIRKEAEKRHIQLKETNVDGNPASEIIKYADSVNAELIVVGATGKKTLERLVIGSVSEKLVRNAKTNVLVVKLKD